MLSNLRNFFACIFIDAFEQLEDEEGTRQGFCHIRIQQRTGRKTITTVQGIAPEYDLKKIVRYLKKVNILFLLKYNTFVVQQSRKLLFSALF